MQWVVFFLFAGTLMALGILQHQRRERRIRHIAHVYGLDFLGTSLPRSFPFSKTSVRRASAIRNAIVGDRGGTTFVIFDCQFGGGKSRSLQTVVAARGSVECFGYQRYDPTLTTESVDNWTLLFRKRELFLPEEIETLLPVI